MATSTTVLCRPRPPEWNLPLNQVWKAAASTDGFIIDGNFCLEFRIATQRRLFHRHRYLLIKHLPVDVTNEEVREMLSDFPISDISVTTTPETAGTAMVMLEDPEMLEDWDKDRLFLLRGQRVPVEPKSSLTTLCVTRIPPEVSEDEFRAMVQSYGPIQWAFKMVFRNGECKNYGFVSYRHKNDAIRAKEKLKTHQWKCRVEYIHPSITTYEGLHSKCLYVSNFPPNYYDVNDFRKRMSAYTPPIYCTIAIHNGKPQNWGLAEYLCSDDAEGTVAMLSGDDNGNPEDRSNDINDRGLIEGRRLAVHFLAPGQRAMQVYKSLLDESISAVVDDTDKGLLPIPENFSNKTVKNLRKQNPIFAKNIESIISHERRSYQDQTHVRSELRFNPQTCKMEKVSQNDDEIENAMLDLPDEATLTEMLRRRKDKIWPKLPGSTKAPLESSKIDKDNFFQTVPPPVETAKKYVYPENDPFLQSVPTLQHVSARYRRPEVEQQFLNPVQPMPATAESFIHPLYRVPPPPGFVEPTVQNPFTALPPMLPVGHTPLMPPTGVPPPIPLPHMIPNALNIPSLAAVEAAQQFGIPSAYQPSGLYPASQFPPVFNVLNVYSNIGNLDSHVDARTMGSLDARKIGTIDGRTIGTMDARIIGSIDARVDARQIGSIDARVDARTMGSVDARTMGSVDARLDARTMGSVDARLDARTMGSVDARLDARTMGSVDARTMGSVDARLDARTMGSVDARTMGSVDARLDARTMGSVDARSIRGQNMAVDARQSVDHRTSQLPLGLNNIQAESSSQATTDAASYMDSKKAKDLKHYISENLLLPTDPTLSQKATRSNSAPGLSNGVNHEHVDLTRPKSADGNTILQESSFQKNMSRLNASKSNNFLDLFKVPDNGRIFDDGIQSAILRTIGRRSPSYCDSYDDLREIVAAYKKSVLEPIGTKNSQPPIAPPLSARRNSEPSISSPILQNGETHSQLSSQDSDQLSTASECTDFPIVSRPTHYLFGPNTDDAQSTLSQKLLNGGLPRKDLFGHIAPLTMEEELVEDTLLQAFPKSPGAEVTRDSRIIIEKKPCIYPSPSKDEKVTEEWMRDNIGHIWKDINNDEKSAKPLSEINGRTSSDTTSGGALVNEMNIDDEAGHTTIRRKSLKRISGSLTDTTIKRSKLKI